MEGKELGKTQYPLSQLTGLREGTPLEIGAKEVEIVKLIPTEGFTSGRIFTHEVKPVTIKPTKSKPLPTKISTIKNTKKKSLLPQPRHDPNAEGAVVLYKAEGTHDKE